MKILIGLFYCIAFSFCTTPAWQLLNKLTWERKGSLILKAKRELFLLPLFLLAVAGLSGWILNIYYEKIVFTNCQLCPTNIIFIGLTSSFTSMFWGYMVVMRKKRQYLIWEERNREMSSPIEIKPKPIMIGNVYLIASEKKQEQEMLKKEEKEQFRAKFAQKKMGKHLAAWDKKFQLKSDKITRRERKRQRAKEKRSPGRIKGAAVGASQETQKRYCRQSKSQEKRRNGKKEKTGQKLADLIIDIVLLTIIYIL